jgi:biopolymer transport protein ExbD
MGASAATGSKKQPEPTINVTPLVDVVLVLLIIFMVVTPALAQGEHIELPAILNPDRKPKDLEPIDVTLAVHGRVLLDKKPIDPQALRGELERMHREQPERKLLLKADSTLPYQQVRELFASIQDIGFPGVSLKVVEKKKGH